MALKTGVSRGEVATASARRPWAHALLVALVACATPAPGEGATPAEAAFKGAPSLTRVGALPAGTLALDPARPRLAVDPGDPLRIYGPDAKLAESWTLGGLATELVFGADGALWAVQAARVTRLVDGAVTCHADIEAQGALGVAPDGRLWLWTQGWEPGGAYGAVVRLDASCAVARGPSSQEVATAADLDGARAWLGTSARVGAGPTRISGPVVLAVQGEAELARWPVFAQRPDVQRVAGIAAGAGNVLALADTGAWELWSQDGRRLVASGLAPGARLVPLPGGEAVAIGDTILDLRTGALAPERLPAPALAVSADGQLWVLGDEGARALWRAN